MKKIQFTVTAENFENDVKRLYTILRPDTKPNEIECDKFGEGCLNSLIKLDDPKSKDPVVIRVYLLKLLGSMTEEQREKERARPSLVNRELELEALKKASELDITVRLCATFCNGFIYKFIEAEMNSFELYDFEVARRTAIKVARLHRVKLGGLARERPAVYRILGKDDPVQEEERRTLFDQKIQECKIEELRTGLPSYRKLSEEFERLHELIFAADAYGPVCFCHNDLNTGNLLIEKNTKEPVLIDFEWADTNFQHHDIAAHLLGIGNAFCREHEPEKIPNEQLIKHWLRSYHEESGRTNNTAEDTDVEQFIDREYKKVLVNMLLVRLHLVRLALLFIFNFPGQIDVQRTAKYAVQVYEDFARNRDDHLSSLEQLK